jgi:hypothetical protein
MSARGAEVSRKLHGNANVASAVVAALRAEVSDPKCWALPPTRGVLSGQAFGSSCAFRAFLLQEGPLATTARSLSPTFGELWPLEQTSRFRGLLRAIDEAALRQRCISRLHRLHRMLSRL